MTMEYLVTGGLGFIGSAYVRRLAVKGASVAIADAMTYAADVTRLNACLNRVTIAELDVASEGFIDLARSVKPRVIVHMAAESHVTRSEGSAATFFRTNVEGTRRVLEAASVVSPELVIHVSTDEVYGPCHGDPFVESDKQPGEGLATSPYARSKAVADDLALAHFPDVPVIVVRPTNCFGPWQHPEKAIPRWIIRALSGDRLPVWGDGLQVRDWMFVDDVCSALDLVEEVGCLGTSYNVGPERLPASNLELAHSVAALTGREPSSVYLSEYDRPQHDRRYAINATKLRELGWKPEGTLEMRLGETVAWYRDHVDWWSGLRGDAEELYDDAEEQSR